MNQTGIEEVTTKTEMQIAQAGEQYPDEIKETATKAEISIEKKAQKVLNKLQEKVYKYAQRLDDSVNKSIESDNFVKILSLEDYQIDLSGASDMMQESNRLLAEDIKGEVKEIIKFVVDFDKNLLDMAAITNLIQARQAQLAQMLLTTDTLRIQELFQKKFNEGWTYKQLAQEFSNLSGLETWRAERIARTEVNSLVGDSDRAYLQGIGVGMIQLSIAKNACRLCAEKEKIQYPVNTKLTPVHPNCRCRTKAVIPQQWLVLKALVEQKGEMVLKAQSIATDHQNKLKKEIERLTSNIEAVTKTITIENEYLQKSLKTKELEIVKTYKTLRDSIEDLSVKYKNVNGAKNQILNQILTIEKSISLISEKQAEMYLEKVQAEDVEGIEELVRNILKDIKINILNSGGGSGGGGTWGSITGNIQNQTDLLNELNLKLDTADLTDANISFSDITINNATTTKHGFLPKLSGNPAQFLNGEGDYSTIPASSTLAGYTEVSFTSQTSVTVTHNFGVKPVVNVLSNTGAVLIPLTITHTSDNAFTVTFDEITTGSIVASAGSQIPNIITVSTNYPITGDDNIVIADTAGITITLPTAVGRAGQTYIIDNASSGNISITGTSGQTIQGETTQTLSSNNSIETYSNNINWRLK
jgi:hypothetical protein